jgi:hypothetical protein
MEPILEHESPYNRAIPGPGREPRRNSFIESQFSTIQPIHRNHPRHKFHINRIPNHRHSVNNRHNRLQTMKLAPLRRSLAPYKPVRLAHWIPRRHLIPQVTARRRKHRQKTRRHTVA